MHHLELDVTEFWTAPAPAAPREALESPAPPAGAGTPRDRGTAFTLEGVGKSYGARNVLGAIDLRVAPGEFVAVVGRSGCGKSTLLRLLAGLEPLDAGRIAFDDAASRPDDRPGPAGPAGSTKDDVRVMFQDARLLPWKRVLDNVALGLPGGDARQRAVEALVRVGLAERAHDWPAVLSGGQRQRVALARALVHAPRLLLLDEPLGALDALTRIEMQRLIERLWRERGFTAVLVTHDVGEAVALADRVLLVEDGRVALDERVALPRPRARGDAAFAALEERILDRVLQRPASADARANARADERPHGPGAPVWPAAASALRWAV